MVIDTDKISARYRAMSIDIPARKLLVTRLQGSQQEDDLTEPVNCGGVGRIRHFRKTANDGWITNPLPIDPACDALGLPRTTEIRAQVFQNAACNWRCWYCYVPFDLLAANPKYAEWLTPRELIDRYLAQPDAPKIIDLSGGQPDLIPEWIPWIMRELQERGIADQTYLWSDDNLSNDYFWRYLTSDEIDTVVGYQNYGKVCCFKGFDSSSFAFNTGAAPDLFDRQFELAKRSNSLGIDLYFYATFTTPIRDGIEAAVRIFVDRLQAIGSDVPLRTVPLRVDEFTPVTGRLNDERRASIEYQWRALDAWRNELHRRYPASALLDETF